MSRLTHVVDIGANPIEGTPPYKPLLDAELCRVTGFEPQASALAELNRKKGAYETYLPYAVGDGREHSLNLCAYSGWTSLFVPSAAALEVFLSLLKIQHGAIEGRTISGLPRRSYAARRS